MTNVRNQRQLTSLPAAFIKCAVKRFVVACLTGPLRAATLVVCISVLPTPFQGAAQAQDFSFGRSPVGTVPSGSASGTVVDSNRQGLGLSIRGGHSAGGTVGRNQSASILGVSPYLNIGDGLLFSDSRFTYANDGGLAWSFGGGYRQYITAWDTVVGGYGYFDRDQISGAHFKQWSVGAELISQRWEARANFYQPFGETSEQTASRVDTTSVTFVDQNIQFTPINTFAEALEGYDAEFGFLFPGKFSERVDLRGFGGGYSYEGVGQSRFAGFSARLQADIGEWLELGLKLTDDEVFHTNVTFNAIVHFGSFESQDHTKRSAIQRMAEPVRRNLNIASNISDIRGAAQIALKADGTPFVIAHVDSSAPAGGTGAVNSPFNQLQIGLSAPADIVFTHAGSTFAAAPDNSVALADNQSLFGEGLIGFPSGVRKVTNPITLPEIGELILPDSPTFASNLATLGLDSTQAVLQRPTLSNTVGDAVTMGNNSSFGGFVVDGNTGTTSNGIVINAVDGAFVRDVLVQNVGGAGVLVQDTAANTSTTIVDTIVDSAVGAGFQVNRGAGNIGFNSTSTSLDPAFGAIFNSNGPAVLIEDRTGGNINMFGSTIDDIGGEGIVIRGNDPLLPTLGNITIDNANIDSSTSTGIAISNADGNITFRNTIRPATTITSPTGVAVDITNLGPNGDVTFEDLNIVTPLAGGINIDGLAGNFTFAQDLVIGVPGAGAAVAPAIRVANSLPTGDVRFGQNVTVNGTNGRGVEIDSNQALSSFRVDGLLTVTGATAEALAITNNDGVVSLTGGTQIAERNDIGILIQNSTGAIAFQDTTSVLNNATIQSTATGVVIDSSESNIIFENLNVTNALNGGGVSLTNNLAGATSDAVIDFQDLEIDSIFGVGLFGSNNTEIRIRQGMIDTQLAAAVDIADSGININLNEVSSANSPDYGISLVNTNFDLRKTFSVVGDLNLQPQGTGGLITQAAFAGANLRNAGQVTLDGMEFQDNNIGIFVRNSGLAVDDDQFLAMQFTSVTESNIRGIDSENLISFSVEDSFFTDNGDAAAGFDGDGNPVGLGARETIRLNYTERLNDEETTRFEEFDNPYLVSILRSEFTDDSDDVISIDHDVTLTDAHLGVDISQNSGQNGFFILNDTNDFDPLDVNENAIEISWDGPSLINITNNAFLLNGTNAAESMGGIFIDMDSGTDLMDLSIVANSINNASSQPNAIGFDLITAGPSNSVISTNDFQLAGDESQGFRFNLGIDTIMSITNNQLLFGGQGGFGIEVERLRSPATFEISGNTIGLTDIVLAGNLVPDDPPLEQGIFFRSATGPYTIFGTQNNVIGLLPGSLGDVDLFAVFNGTVNGQIIVNGAAGP